MTDRNKILIADDEESMRTLPEIILNEHFPSFKTETFKDGSALEARLKKGTEDVKAVITDHKMGRYGPTGGEIILKHARNPEYKDIRFILCYEGLDLLGKIAKTVGAFACIKKPFSEEDYINVVGSALEGK